MITWIKLLPYLIAVAAGIGIGSFGTIKIANGLKTEYKCPDCLCNCPKIEPCPPSIDYDKIRGKNIDLTIHQHNHYHIAQDSTELLPTLKQIIEKSIHSELEKVPVVKCKGR